MTESARRAVESQAESWPSAWSFAAQLHSPRLQQFPGIYDLGRTLYMGEADLLLPIAKDEIASSSRGLQTSCLNVLDARSQCCVSSRVQLILGLPGRKLVQRYSFLAAGAMLFNSPACMLPPACLMHEFSARLPHCNIFMGPAIARVQLYRGRSWQPGSLMGLVPVVPVLCLLCQYHPICPCLTLAPQGPVRGP